MRFSPYVLLAGLVVSMPASAGYILIDTFQTPQSVVVTAAAPASTNSVALTALAVGVERDIRVTKTSGVNGTTVGIYTNPFGFGALRQDISASTRGSTLISWDGIDNNASVVAYTGLGGLNLGVGNGFFEIDVIFSDRGGPVTFTIYDASDVTGTKRATGMVNIPQNLDVDYPNNPPQISTLNFAGMSLLGGATSAIFSNIGAITMLIDATAIAQSGWDLGIAEIRAFNGIPNPAGLALLGLGLTLLPLYRRRK